MSGEKKLALSDEDIAQVNNYNTYIVPGLPVGPICNPSVAALQAALTPAAAVSLLVFCLLYTPCVAAVSSFKRELGSKWAFGIVVEQCVVAWIAALIIGILMRVIGFA